MQPSLGKHICQTIIKIICVAGETELALLLFKIVLIYTYLFTWFTSLGKILR